MASPTVPAPQARALGAAVSPAIGNDSGGVEATATGHVYCRPCWLDEGRRVLRPRDNPCPRCNRFGEIERHAMPTKGSHDFGDCPLPMGCDVCCEPEAVTERCDEPERCDNCGRLCDGYCGAPAPWR